MVSLVAKNVEFVIIRENLANLLDVLSIVQIS